MCGHERKHAIPGTASDRMASFHIYAPSCSFIGLSAQYRVQARKGGKIMWRRQVLSNEADAAAAAKILYMNETGLTKDKCVID